MTKKLNKTKASTYILNYEEKYLSREDELQADGLWEHLRLDFEDY